METPNVALNIFDIVLFVIIGYGMFKGYKKGMVKSLIGVVGIFVAFLLGINLNYVFYDFFRRNFDLPDMYISLLSFGLMFVLVLIILTFLLKFFEDLLSKLNLGINNALGALVGGYFAAMVLSILLMLTRPLNIPSDRSISDSVTYPFIQPFAKDNLKLLGRALPWGMNALRKLDKVVKERMPQQDGTPDGTPEPAQPEAKPTPVR